MTAEALPTGRPAQSSLTADVLGLAAIGLMLVPGAFLGHRLAKVLPLNALTRLVGITLIAAGVSFAFKAAA